VIYWLPADGSAAPEVVLPRESRGFSPWSISPDAKVLLLSSGSSGSKILTSKIEWDSSGRPHLSPAEPLLNTQFTEMYPAVSPDGRWLAYASNETGSPEVYVHPFPGPGGRTQISIQGGVMPMWSAAAHEIFFRDPSQRIQVVEYSAVNGAFRAGKPRVWSDTRVLNLANLQNHDLASDGKRMAIIPAMFWANEKNSPTLTVLLNFPDELRRRLGESK